MKNSPAYFQQLNQTLKSYQRAIPSLIVDLDRLDRNIALLREGLSEKMAFRIVVKSLPSIPLIDYIMGKTETNKLMVFHQPFLSTLAQHYGDQVDILMGKPMPVQTADFFYQGLNKATSFQASRQLQWLIDTEQRLLQYLDLSKRHKEKLLINLEIDIGLHRGGFGDIERLRSALQLIEVNRDQLEFTGFMGYDPHVALLPKFLRSPKRSFQLANETYRNCIELVKKEFPNLWQEQLTINGGGSPTLAYHQNSDSVLNDISAGSGLVKPSHFDLDSLSAYVPACFLATPILKKFEGTTLPALEKFKGLLSFFKPAFKTSYFIYGGYWKADLHYPPGSMVNPLFGNSTNQSMINTSSKLDLDVDDFIFFRPKQSEFVFLQFGDVLVVRNGQIEEEWAVLT